MVDQHTLLQNVEKIIFLAVFVCGRPILTGNRRVPLSVEQWMSTAFVLDNHKLLLTRFTSRLKTTYSLAQEASPVTKVCVDLVSKKR